MVFRKLDLETDPTSLCIEASDKLADEIAMHEFEVAMQDPDGSISVELVARCLEIFARRERDMRNTVSRNLARPGLRFTVVQAGLLAESSKDETVRIPELDGHAASLYINLSDRAVNN